MTITLRSIAKATTLLFVFVGVYGQAAPVLKSLNPAGAQRGSTLMLRLLGQDLSLGSELITTLPATVSRLTPSKDLKMPETEIPFLIQLGRDAVAGLYPIRIRNSNGISNVLLFSVSEFPEIQEMRNPSADVDEESSGGGRALVQKIAPPVVVNGTLDGAEQDWFAFKASAGQTWVFEVEARRVGSALDPALRIIDDSGRQIAFNDDAPLIGVDSRVQVTFHKTGDYRVGVQDTRFSRQDQNFYRLKVGTFLYAEQIFPLGWQRGRQIDVTFSGGNLAQPVTVRPNLDFAAPQPLALISLPAGQASAVALPIPFVLGDLPEVIEPADTRIRDLPADTIVNGRISQPGEKDSYRLKVNPAEKWLIELDAAALGTSRLQAHLSILDRAGKVLASIVDAVSLNIKTGFSFSSAEKGIDPKTIFQVPDQVDEIVLVIEDANLAGGPDFGYRLRASRQWEDFRLEAAVPFSNIPASGSAVVPVRATRVGYQGPIRLTAEGVPEMLIVEGGHIPAGAREGLLTVSAKAGSAGSLLSLRIWGEATTSTKQSIRRQAIVPALVTPISAEPGLSMKPFAARWLSAQLPVAVNEPAAIEFHLPEQQITVAQGMKRQLSLRLTSSAPANYPVRLTVRLPSGTTLRGKAVTLTPGKENSWDGSVELAAEFDTSVARLDFVLEARPEPPGRPIVYTSPAVQVDVVRAYALQLHAETVEIKGKSTTELTGKVIRESSFKGEVSVHLEDLPEHITSIPVQIAADASEFKIPLIAEPRAEPGEYEVRLASNGKMEGRKDKADYSVPDLKLKLVVPAGRPSGER